MRKSKVALKQIGNPFSGGAPKYRKMVNVKCLSCGKIYCRKLELLDLDSVCKECFHKKLELPFFSNEKFTFLDVKKRSRKGQKGLFKCNDCGAKFFLDKTSVRYKRCRYCELKKSNFEKANCFKDIYIGGNFKYSNKGKDELTKHTCKTLMSIFDRKITTLTLPDIGRELKIFSEFDILEDKGSVGLEKLNWYVTAKKMFFKSLFPRFVFKKAEIHRYIRDTKNQFDFAHIDLCGPLIDSQSTGISTKASVNKLLKKGTITQVTFQDRFYRYSKRKSEKLESDFLEVHKDNVVSDVLYSGLRGIKMRSLLIVP